MRRPLLVLAMLPALAACDNLLDLGGGSSSPSPAADAGADGSNVTPPDGGASGDGAAPSDGEGGAPFDDTVGCDGTLALDAPVTLVAELAGDVFPAVNGYVAFFPNTNGVNTLASELRIARLGEQLDLLGPAITLFPESGGSVPSWAVRPDGTGFLATAFWENENGFRITTLDEHGVPTWDVETPPGGTVMAAGPGTPVGGAPDVLVSFTDVAGPLGLVLPRGSSQITWNGYRVDSVCADGLDPVIWNVDHFEAVCSDGYRVAIRPDGRTSLEPVTLTDYPAGESDRCHFVWKERAAGAFVRTASSFPKLPPGSPYTECDLTHPGTDASSSYLVSTLRDGASAWGPWVPVLQFSQIDRQSELTRALDTHGIVAAAKGAQGSYEVRRATLDGATRGAPFTYSPPAGTSSLALVPVRNGYLVKSYASATLVKVERLTCR